MNQHEHEYMHEHGIEHAHEHQTPEHDHEYMHAHGIEHSHDHAHCTSEEGCGHDCAGCASSDPKAELIALMRYMVNHNTSHANELAQLAGKLREMGEAAAYEQVMLAVSDFEKGNLRLSAVLSALNA